MSRFRKLDFFEALVFLNLYKFLNLVKNTILLLLFLLLRILLFTLLVVLSTWFLSKDGKVFYIKINSTIIYIAKIFNKILIKIGKANKYLNILYQVQFKLISNYFNLFTFNLYFLA